MLLAFLCVGTLVFFVAHKAVRITVDTVIDLVSRNPSDLAYIRSHHTAFDAARFTRAA